jgi:hypothetical protein
VTRTKTLAAIAGFALAALGGTWLTSCGPAPFPDESLINSVRLLATRADHSYATPGETVTLTVLATDQRPSKPEPMVIYWLPDPLTGKVFCENPANDAYYGCFIPPDGGASDAGSGDAGASHAGSRDAGSEGGGGSPCALPVPGVDLTPCLPPPGPTLSFSLPEDIVTSHPPPKGTAPPYGLAIVFNMACAGHPELLPLDPNNLSVNSLPVGCFDKNHNALDANSYVVGYATVYAYEASADITNENPVIAHVLFQGKDLEGGVLGDSSTAQDAGSPEEGGAVMPPCTVSDSSKCPKYSFDVDVPPSSQERDKLDLGSNGEPLGEQIWVDYYSTTGSLSDDARLLYDPTIGKVTTGTAITFQAPAKATPGILWAVVHDNRGGVAWEIVPFAIR